MTLMQAIRELSDAWLILTLLINLGFFAYLAFRLGRDRDLFGPARENLLPAPKAVRVDQPGFWREKK